MKYFLTIIVLLFILGSCGKKSEPKYQGSIKKVFNKI